MSSVQAKHSFFDNFRITDRESCAKAIRNGGIGALISAGLTAILAAVGFFEKSSNEELNYLINPWSMLDAVLITVLAIFVFRKSRVASTLLVIYFIASHVLMWIDLRRLDGLAMAIMWGIFYITAMRATYRWHRSYDATPG